MTIVRDGRLQTKLRALSRPMYKPPEGVQIADINKAWVILETSESDHDAALVEEIKRLTRLEQVRSRPCTSSARPSSLR